MKTLAKIICLTVQSNGSGGFRLGINSSDSKNHFERRGRQVIIRVKNAGCIYCKTACGIIDWKKESKDKRKKSYDLNSKLLSAWITSNGPHKRTGKKPTRLSFSLKHDVNKDIFILEFIKKGC